MQRRVAISLFESPSAMSRTTWRSRIVRRRRRSLLAAGREPRHPAEQGGRDPRRQAGLAAGRAEDARDEVVERGLALDEPDHAELRERDHVLLVVRDPERNDRRVGALGDGLHPTPRPRLRPSWQR